MNLQRHLNRIPNGMSTVKPTASEPYNQRHVNRQPTAEMPFKVLILGLDFADGLLQSMSSRLVSPAAGTGVGTYSSCIGTKARAKAV